VWRGTCLRQLNVGGCQQNNAAVVPVPSSCACTQHADTLYWVVAVLVCRVCCSCSSGIPLAFPQWRDGQLPYNGFADKLEWTVVGTVRHGGRAQRPLDYSADGWCLCGAIVKGLIVHLWPPVVIAFSHFLVSAPPAARAALTDNTRRVCCGMNRVACSTSTTLTSALPLRRALRPQLGPHSQLVWALPHQQSPH
jgi:hypothetical protein